MTRMQRLRLWVTGALALAPVGVASLLLWSTFLTFRPDQSGDPVPLYHRPAKAERKEWGTMPAAQLELTAHKFHAPEQKLDVTLTLNVPLQLTEWVYDILKQQYVWEEGQPGQPPRKLRPEYSDAQLTLICWSQLTGTLETRVIPLSHLFPGGRYFALYSSTFTDKLELPLVGQAFPYPNDWYALAAEFQLEFPTFLTFRPPDDRPEVAFLKNTSHFPVELTIRAVGGTDGKSFVVLQKPSDKPDSRVLELVITRNNVTLLFTYVLGVVPVLFAALLAHMLFLNPRSREIRSEELLIDAAAVLLAILPLRAVLVPAEVTVLTRLDAILALGIALVISLVLLKYVTQLAPRGAPEPPPPPATGTQGS